jgi:hypothetical protein
MTSRMFPKRMKKNKVDRNARNGSPSGPII